jgi:hypothetical protein
MFPLAPKSANVSGDTSTSILSGGTTPRGWADLTDDGGLSSRADGEGVETTLDSMTTLMLIGSQRSHLRKERQRLLARASLPGDCRSSLLESGAREAVKRSGEEELFESLSLATQERELLVREKGLLEGLLKSTTEELSRLVEAEAVSEEQRIELQEQLRQTEKHLAAQSLLAEEERHRANHAREDAENMRAQLKMSQDKCVESERACACLEKKCTALQGELEAVRSLALHARDKDEWDRQEARIMKAEAGARHNQERVAEMLHQAGEHAKERAVWQDQRKALILRAEEVKSLQEQLEDLRNSERRAVELQKECTGVQEKLYLVTIRAEKQQAALDTNALEIASLQDENKKLSSQVVEHQNSNARMMHKVDAMEREAAAATRDRSEQIGRVRCLETEAAANAKHLAAVEAQNSNLARELDAANRMADDNKREGSELKTAVQTLRKDLQRAKEVENTLTQAREEADVERAALQKEIREAKDSCHRDASSLAALREQSESLQASCDTLAGEKAAFQDECNRLNLRIQLCNQELQYHRSIERAQEARSTDWMQAHSALLNNLQRRPGAANRRHSEVEKPM